MYFHYVKVIGMRYPYYSEVQVLPSLVSYILFYVTSWSRMAVWILSGQNLRGKQEKEGKWKKKSSNWLFTPFRGTFSGICNHFYLYSLARNPITWPRLTVRESGKHIILKIYTTTLNATGVCKWERMQRVDLGWATRSFCLSHKYGTCL